MKQIKVSINLLQCIISEMLILALNEKLIVKEMKT